jgi:(S)-citramalyl-CoA lyase
MAVSGAAAQAWTASSLLFVPGSRPDRFAKALASGADLICIDLEDAVAAGDKDAARLTVVEALAQLDLARAAVRINGLATPDGLRDLLALRDATYAPACLLVPMAASPCHVEIARSVLGRPEVGIVPLIETIAGLRAAADIASSPGVAAMMFGGGDLSAELGVALAWEPLLAARGQFVLACAGRGIGLIDVPFVALDDLLGLEREATKARALGFTAKAAIHPDQLPAIRRAFAPSREEVAEAREALAAFRAGGGQAVRYRGRLLEAPLVRRYEAMLQQGEAANA